MMESKINMVNTIAKLKSSSRETGSATLPHVTPSSLISRVDSTLTPNPIQVLDRKQERTLAPLCTKSQSQVITLSLTHVDNCSYRSARNKYGKKLTNHVRNPTSIPITGLEKKELVAITLIYITL